MYKTNDIHSLMILQNKNNKPINKNKVKEKQEKNKEKNPYNMRNRINLSLKPMTQFQNQKPPFQKTYSHFERQNSNSKKSLQKAHHSKCLTVSNSILYNEIFNTNSNTLNTKNSKKNLKKIEINKDEIINSYEKGIIAIFDNLKIILDKNKYEDIKNKFLNEFEGNLNYKKGNLNNLESSLSVSNSIKKMIDDCIQKKVKNMKQKKIKFFQNHPNLRQSHKSLYSLSRYNNRLFTQSPNKITKNENESTFENNYFSEKNNYKNSKSTQNGSSNISGNKTSNSKNISNPNNVENNIGKINKNQINKTTDDSSCDLLSKIKDSIDDDLKCMFNFSYENFLNKESERFDKK